MESSRSDWKPLAPMVLGGKSNSEAEGWRRGIPEGPGRDPRDLQIWVIWGVTALALQKNSALAPSPSSSLYQPAMVEGLLPCDYPFPVQFSRSVMSDSLRPHESQHAIPKETPNCALSSLFPREAPTPTQATRD